MSANSLFPSESIAIAPAQDRPAPALWIRRLVVVAERKPDVTPIREVSFRLGLNVIRTASPDVGETRPVGHSVGKTLLTRLIRYCLGEASFATKSVRNRIESQFPEGFVLAELVVGGSDLVVARPLRAASIRQSFVLPASDYTAALVVEPPDKKPFSDLTDLLTSITVGNWVDLLLPNAGHRTRWLDLLSWLARDHECRYRVFNEWREPDAESGTATLHRNDASFFLRLAMDLVDSREKDLIARHSEILKERSLVEKAVEDQERLLKFNRTELSKRIELPGEAPVEGLFSDQIVEAAQAKRESLQRLLDEFRTQSAVASLEAESARLADELADATSAAREKAGFLKTVQAQLAPRRTMTRDQYLQMVGPRANCSHPECPFKKENLEAVVDPHKDELLAQLREHRDRLEHEIAALRERMPSLQQQRREAVERLSAARQEYEARTRGTTQALGRQELIIELAQDYERARREHFKAVQRLAVLNRAYQESLSQQALAREIQAAKQRRLSEIYDWVLKKLVTPEAEGRVELDAVGLRPEPVAGVAANGAALATLARVLGFDLACLTASVCGQGHHVRLLIHDSPKEADMEGTLYERIFMLALELERTFGERPPSFQYIVTTTTPPPANVAEPPYTRLTLHARDASGLLLKAQF